MKIRDYAIVGALLFCVLMSGCNTFEAQEEVFDRFMLTTLNQSESSDILMVLKKEGELLSQGENVLASYGRNSGHTSKNLWFNMVAFDEDKLTAIRKYSFCFQETDHATYINPDRRFRFDCAGIVPGDVLGEPYTNENAKRIAVLEYMLDTYKDDCGQVTEDSQDLIGGTLLARRSLNSVLVMLNNSPALASRLSDYTAVEFDDMNFGQSYIRMLIEEDVCKIKIKSGKNWFTSVPFDDQKDVTGM